MHVPIIWTFIYAGMVIGVILLYIILWNIFKGDE